MTFILHNLQTDEITARLRDGRLDLGIARQDAMKSPLKCTRLGVVEYRVAVPKASFRLADKGDGWGALKRHPVALLAGSEVTSALENAAEKKGIRLNVCLRGTSYAQLVEAVRSAGCAAILPAFVSQAQAGADVEFFSLNALKEYRRAIGLGWNPHFCGLRPAILSVSQAVATALQGMIESRGGADGGKTR